MDIDKKQIELRDTPCETREELDEWLKLFLDVELPNHIVDIENSNCTPLDMVWMIYESALYTQKLQNALFIANRAGSKTFDAAVVEFLLLQHDHRDITHIGAIEKQAKRAYQYFQQFYHKPMFKEFVDKMVMEKTTIKNRGTLEVLPCSLAAVNGPHTPFVCVHGKALILVDNRDKQIEQSNRERVTVSASRLHKLIQSGQKINAITYNQGEGTLEIKPILASYQNGLKDIIEIRREKGKPLLCTPDHKLFDPTTQTFKKAIEFKEGGDVVVIGKGKTLSDKPIYTIKEESLPYQYKDLTKEQIFEQLLIGSQLGDGGINKRYVNSLNYWLGITHGEKQLGYLKWKYVKLKEIASSIYPDLIFSDIKEGKSGYSDNKIFSFTVRHPTNGKRKENIFTKYGDSKTFFKDIIPRIEALGLAIWYMDDGSNGTFSTHSHTLEEIEILKNTLMDKFGIKTKIVPVKSGKYHILVIDGIKSKTIFYNLVSPYISDDFKYKLSRGFGHYLCEECGKQEFSINKRCNGEKICVLCKNKANHSVKNQKIVSIINKKRKSMTYDFTVEGNHNYFANNILVHNCMDEIDTVQDLQAYKDILGIPIPMKDGRPPIKIGISTRKTLWGLVQQSIDDSKKTGLQVFYWGILEVTKRCPDSRSGTQRQPIYVNIERMEALSKPEWNLLPDKQKTEYTFYEGYIGCLTNCKIFPACRGHLKNQKCTSPYLRSIDFVQQQLLEVSPDWALAQHLCLKPSPQGQIFSNFKPAKSIKTYKEMIEIFLGEEIHTKRPVTLEDLVTIFEGKGLTATMGVDFGFTDPYFCVLLYIDSVDNIYVVKELSVTGQDGAEMAHFLKENWLSKYKIEIVYPDIESPSNIKLLRKAGFNCAGAKKDAEAQGATNARYVNKDVKGGIETIRRFIKVPGQNETKLFISPDCTELLEAISKYHYVVDKFDNVKSDEPDHEFSHGIDALRYPLHSIFGHKIPQAELDIIEEDYSYINDPNSRLTAPTPTELGILNQTPINDNSEEYEELKKKLEAQRQIRNHLGIELKHEDEEDGQSDGFSFVF